MHSSNRGGATNIWFLPLDGGSPVRLRTGAGPDESPSVSRDGAVAFVNARLRYALLTLDFESGQQRTLASHSPIIWSPAFSPDGQELAFSRAEADGSWHIWTIPVEGGTPKRLTSTERGELYPRYTADGEFVVFFSWVRPRRVWRVPRRGGPATALTPEESRDASFGNVSPDGNWLAFARAHEDAEQVHVLAVEGGSELPQVDLHGSVPRWSPDGKWIAFSRDRGYEGGIFVVAAEGGDPRRLTDTGGWPVWWPDGQQIGYLVVGPDGGQRIRIVPFAGGSSNEIATVQFVGSNWQFDVSPDGKLLATSNNVHVSGEIWLLEREL